MKRIELTLTTVLASTLLLAGCNEPGSDGWTADRDTAICVDQSTSRVPDASCETGTAHGQGGSAAWYYLGRNNTIPPYGGTPMGGSFTRTDGATYFHAPVETAVSRATAISRGGFGESAHGFSEGGGFGE